MRTHDFLMRDSQREQWESDPDRSLVQSDAWNRAILLWSIGLPILILLIALLGFLPDWTWKMVTAVMMLAFASGSPLQILGWVVERIKYRDR